MAFEADTIKTHVISADETGNSTKTLLTGSATYTGAWEDVTGFTTVAVTLLGDNATDGTIWIEASMDGGSVVNSVPFAVSDTTFNLPEVWNIVETHIRIKYVNGTTAQTGFFQLQTKYSNGQELGLLQSAGDTIGATTAVQITKAISTGTDPDGVYKNQVESGVNTVNSSTVNLGVSASFTGTYYDVSGYHGITVLVDGTSAGTADGTLFMEFSHDGVTAHRSISVPVADVTDAPPRTLGNVAKYFRVRYDNGTTAMTSFDLQTMFHTEQIHLVSRLSGSLNANADVQDTRSVIMSQQPDGTYKQNPHNGQAFSTSANLSGAAAYVSGWVDTDGYQSIELFIKTDVVSADQGIVIDFTDDLSGTPTAQASESYTFSATDVAHGALNLFIAPKLVGFRLTYTNGAGAQSSNLIQCDLKTNGTTNTYNSGGGLLTADFSTEVALDHVNNYSHGEMVGIVNLQDNADGEATIWNAADDDYANKIARKTFKSTAVQMWIASDSASDTTKDIHITYNDSNNELAEVTITLTGTTPVDCGVTAYDVCEGHLSSADDTLVGNISIQQGNAFTAGVPDDITDVMAYIKPDFGRTSSATFRVPSNKKMSIDHVYLSLQRAGGVAGAGGANLRVKKSGESWTILRPYLLGTSQVVNVDEQIIIEPDSLVEFTCTAPSDTDTNVNAIISYTLVSE